MPAVGYKKLHLLLLTIDINKPDPKNKCELMEITIKKSDLFTVSVLGEFSSGKSTLINAIFFKDDILPTDAGVCTSIPAEICYGNRLELHVLKPKGTVVVTGRDDIKNTISKTSKKNLQGVTGFMITTDNPVLKGMRIIDTPGLNSPNEVHSALTMKIIEQHISNLVLWVIDLNQGATAPILDMLERLKAADDRCCLIANHVDKIAKSGGIEAVQKAMKELEKKAYMFPKVLKSCALDGLRGAMNNNPALFTKANMPDILSHVLERRETWQQEGKEFKRIQEVELKKERIEKLTNEREHFKQCRRNALEDIEKLGIDLKDFIQNNALNTLENTINSTHFKKIMADVIDIEIDTIAKDISPKTSPFRFLLAVKNSCLPKVNALLAAHITICMHTYGETINNYIAAKIEKITENIKYKANLGTSSGTNLPSDSFEEAIANILSMILALVGTITAAIAAFFIQQTVTYLFFITIATWNPVGIAIASIGAVLAAVGIVKITSVEKKVKEKIKEKFGVPAGSGICDQIWRGGTLDQPKQIGMFSEAALELTDAGKQLLEDLENPPNLAQMMCKSVIEWAMEKLNAPSGPVRQSLVESVLQGIRGGGCIQLKFHTPAYEK